MPFTAAPGLAPYPLIQLGGSPYLGAMLVGIVNVDLDITPQLQDILDLNIDSLAWRGVPRQVLRTPGFAVSSMLGARIARRRPGT